MGSGDKQPLGTVPHGPRGQAVSRRARSESGAGHAGAGAEGSNGTLRALTGQGPARALRPPGKTAATARPRRPDRRRPGPPRRQLVPLFTRGARPAPPPPCPPSFLPPSRPPARPGGSDRPSRQPRTRRPRYLGLLADRIVRAEQVAEEGVELLLLRRRHCCEREGEGGRGSAGRAAGGGTRGGAATPVALPLAATRGASPPIGPASL